MGAVERGVVGEDRALQLLQLRPGLEAEVAVEQLPALLVRLEGLCLAAGAVQRKHQKPTQPLAMRVLSDQRFQLGDEL